jgi:hypothetical protein
MDRHSAGLVFDMTAAIAHPALLQRQAWQTA